MTRRFIDMLTSEQRKEFPMCTGFVDYFPDAMAAVSHVSFNGNQKHNKGKPLHHARGKSMDHADCETRHQSTRFDPDPAYINDVLAQVYHLAEKAWRAMAELQEAMEKTYGLPLAPAARFVDAPRVPMFAPDLAQADVPRCEAVDPNSPGTRCALVAGHDGVHRGESLARAVAQQHTCAIGSKERCPACEAELGKLPPGADRGEPIVVACPAGPEPGDGFCGPPDFCDCHRNALKAGGTD